MYAAIRTSETYNNTFDCFNFDNPCNCLQQQFPIALALHQQAADDLGGDDLGGAAEEGWGEMVWEGLVAMGVAWRMDNIPTNT